MSQQGAEKSIFRVIFRIGFDVVTAMILQNTISRFNLLRIERFDSWVCYVKSNEKKSVECHSKEQRRAFSELSFELTLTLQRFPPARLIVGPPHLPTHCTPFLLYKLFSIKNMSSRLSAKIFLNWESHY